MKPYGRRKPVHTCVKGHQNCSICHPEDVNKTRERIETKKEILAEEFIEDYYGKRCPAFCEECVICENWEHLDKMKANNDSSS